MPLLGPSGLFSPHIADTAHVAPYVRLGCLPSASTAQSKRQNRWLAVAACDRPGAPEEPVLSQVVQTEGCNA